MQKLILFLFFMCPFFYYAQEEVTFSEDTPPDERIGFKIDKSIFQNFVGNEYFSEKDKLYFYIEYTEKTFDDIKETFQSLKQTDCKKLPFYVEEKNESIMLLHCRESKKDGIIDLIKDTYIKKYDEEHVIIVTFTYPKDKEAKCNNEALSAIKTAKYFKPKDKE